MKRRSLKRAPSVQRHDSFAFSHPNPVEALLECMKEGRTFADACEKLAFDPAEARRELLGSEDFSRALAASINEERTMALASYASLRARATGCLQSAMLDGNNREAVRAAVQILKDLSQGADAGPEASELQAFVATSSRPARSRGKHTR